MHRMHLIAAIRSGVKNSTVISAIPNIRTFFLTAMLFLGEDPEDLRNEEDGNKSIKCSESIIDEQVVYANLLEKFHCDPDLENLIKSITYSARYQDDTHEYRHVILPKRLYAEVNGIFITSSIFLNLSNKDC